VTVASVKDGETEELEADVPLVCVGIEDLTLKMSVSIRRQRQYTS